MENQCLLWDSGFMSEPTKTPDGTRLTLAEVANLQAIENAPLSADQIAMLEMFERKGWSAERRAAHIRDKYAATVPTVAE